MAGLVGDLRRRPGDVLASGAPGEPLLVWVGAVVILNERREKALRDGLRELPETVAMAAAALPGEHLGGEGGGRSVPGSRPPLNMDAAALTGYRDLDHPTTWPIRDGGIVWVDGHGRVDADDSLPGSALSVLASWTRLAEAELLDADPGAWTPLADKPTVASECAWLLRHIVWLLEQQWADELADDVHRLLGESRHVLRVRPDYRPRCQREGCGGTLRDEGALWRCDLCDHTADDRGGLGLRQIVARQDPMTVAELVKAFRFNPKTVESWVGRGQLVPVDGSTPRRFHPLDALRLGDAGGAHVG